MKQDHSGEALLSNGKRGDKWEVSKHSSSKPTNAYGELEFQGAGQVSRAKVSSTLNANSYWLLFKNSNTLSFLGA